MNRSMTVAPTLANPASEKSGHHESDGKQPLDLTLRDFKWPFFFLLCFSALGLKFPLAYLLMPVILLNRFRNDRYDFTIMITLLCGGFGITAKNTFGFHLYFLFLCIAFFGLFFYKKTGLVRRIVVAWTLFVLGLLTFAMMSDERLVIQLGSLTRYIALIYFIIPLMLFAGRKFEIKEFFGRLMPICLLLCVWYILDCVVVSGWFFIPNTQNPWADPNIFSTFDSPIWTGFFTFPVNIPTDYTSRLSQFSLSYSIINSRAGSGSLYLWHLPPLEHFRFIFAMVATYLF